MKALSVILMLLGILLFIYGAYKLAVSIKNKKKLKKVLGPHSRKSKAEKSYYRHSTGLLVGSFFLLIIGAAIKPTHAEVEEPESALVENLEAEETQEDQTSAEESPSPSDQEDEKETSEVEVTQTATENNKDKTDKSDEEDKKAREALSTKEREEKNSEKETSSDQASKTEDTKEEISPANPNKSSQSQAPTKPLSVPEGKEYVVVNDNIPYFSNDDLTSTEAYEHYGPLDSLGRVTAANAVLGVELMPDQERGDISEVKPTGWVQARYAGIGSGGWLYNRSHLIGFQLTAEDANPNNLMTGTRWFNVEGMLPFENFVADYIERTENHVRYRITPIFEGNNLLATGVYMEGFSIEDNGEGIMFNIFVPNRQPGVEINYATGESVGPEGPSQSGEVSNLNKEDASQGGGPTSKETNPTSGSTIEQAPQESPSPSGKIKGNINNKGEKIYHVPGGQYYDRTDIDTSKGERWFNSPEEAKAAGWRPSKR